MGKGKDFRDPRKRGFDDDNYFMPESPAGSRPMRPRGFEPPPPEGAPIEATVKWFNPEKGFGFAELSDGSGDAFLHIGVVQAAGKETVPPGAKLKCHVGQGQKGKQITHVVEIDESAAAEYRRPPRPGFGGGGGHGGPRPPRAAPDPSTAVELLGTVKWFNGEKGFGFVTVPDGGKDVFLHISVLERAQLTHLAEGQRVTMRVVDTPKGREAISIALDG